MLTWLPTPLRRLAYRSAYVVLALGSRIVRPNARGAKMLVTAGDDVLLVMHTYGPRQWDLPGGFSRHGEPYGDTARRELAEELGIEPVRWTSLGEYRRAHHGRRETLGAFHVEVARTETFDVDRAELAEVRWFPYDALPAPCAAVVPLLLAAVWREGAK